MAINVREESIKMGLPVKSITIMEAHRHTGAHKEYVIDNFDYCMSSRPELRYLLFNTRTITEEYIDDTQRNCDTIDNPDSIPLYLRSHPSFGEGSYPASKTEMEMEEK